MRQKTVRCECGGHYYQNENGYGVCEVCKAVVTMEDLLVIGLRPTWDSVHVLRLNVLD